MIRRHRIAQLSVLLTLVGLFLVVAYISGCADNQSPSHDSAASHADPIALAKRELALITIQPEHNGDYRREDWPHWRQGRSKCISVREEVLIAESKEPVVMTADGCVIISGYWLDAYTGNEVTDPKQLDVDHMVPLEEANQSGGWTWSRDQRAAYANDLTDPHTLIAVSVAANRSKGSKDPEHWLPSNETYRCQYVTDWVTIKARWHLSVDQREFQFLENVLSNCAASID